MERGKVIHIKKNDIVNSPSHYTQNKVEVIESIADALSNEEFIGYLKANIMKYLLRAGKKRGSAATEDMGKATWYISRLQRRLFTIEHENRKSKDR